MSLLLGKNADVNKQDNNGRTALMEGNLYCFFYSMRREKKN